MAARLKAAAKQICIEYVTESGLVEEAGADDENNTTVYKSWVPSSVRKKTADYVRLWHQAIPIHGIIIGKSPSPSLGKNMDVSPRYAAGFSYNENLWGSVFGKRPPASADTMAYEISLSCHVEESDVLVAIRDCWKQKKFGVVCVNAVPLGREEDDRENGMLKEMKKLTRRDLRQIEILARTLSKLVCLSADFGQTGSTTVIALGYEAQICARKLEKFFSKSKRIIDDDLENPRHSWKLKVHELYHPARTMWVYKKRKLPFLTMAKTSRNAKTEFQALCSLLARGFHFRPTAATPDHNRLRNDSDTDDEEEEEEESSSSSSSPGGKSAKTSIARTDDDLASSCIFPTDDLSSSLQRLTVDNRHGAK